MIEDPDDPAMQAAVTNLNVRLRSVLIGKQWDRSALRALNQIIYDHRVDCRTRGLDFPRLTAVVIPRLGVIKMVRADLDRASIRQTVVNFVRDNPNVTREELAVAFRQAFPDLRQLSYFVDEVESRGLVH